MTKFTRWKSGTFFISQCTVKYICAKNGVFPSKSFHCDDAKRNLDQRPSGKKNDPDGPAEKTNKKVQGRETIRILVEILTLGLVKILNLKSFGMLMFG